ncbi:TrmB family transcriptional regulator [Candidatus Bathyarchaeota archaeon]|nr:TrmB family transcriptional regulator [Candidatus Bathyarchaeota archaeon]
MTLAKHSVTKKSEILADTIDEDDLFENMKSLRFHLRDLSEFKEFCSSFSRFGLSKNEAKVYIYLAKFGDQKAHNISRSLSLHRTETYKILRRLEEKGLAVRLLEKPIKFAAVPVDKALTTLIQEKKERVMRLEGEKQKILESWSVFSVPTRESEFCDEFIQVLKGRNQIHIKVNEIIENAKDEVLIAASDETLLQMFYSGALDSLSEKSSKIEIRLLTDSSVRSSYIVKKLRLSEDKFFCVNFKGIPSFVISQDHLLLFLNNEGSNGKNGKRALWTNQKDIIKVLKTSFFTLSSYKKPLKIIT